jgi:hypothetical protein
MAALLRAAFNSVGHAGGALAVGRAMRGFHTGGAWTNSTACSRRIALGVAHAPAATATARVATVAPMCPLGVAVTASRPILYGVRGASASAYQPLGYQPQRCPAPPATPASAPTPPLGVLAAQPPLALPALTASPALSYKQLHKPAGHHSARTAMQTVLVGIYINCARHVRVQEAFRISQSRVPFNLFEPLSN